MFIFLVTLERSLKIETHRGKRNILDRQRRRSFFEQRSSLKPTGSEWSINFESRECKIVEKVEKPDADSLWLRLDCSPVTFAVSKTAKGEGEKKLRQKLSKKHDAFKWPVACCCGFSFVVGFSKSDRISCFYTCVQTCLDSSFPSTRYRAGLLLRNQSFLSTKDRTISCIIWNLVEFFSGLFRRANDVSRMQEQVILVKRPKINFNHPEERSRTQLQLEYNGSDLQT